MIESTAGSEVYELIVRDKTGFVFFGIQGFQNEYDATGRLIRISDGKLLVTREFATQLGAPAGDWLCG